MSLQDNDFAPKPAGKWWLVGKKPDYRFTLANERTFLAWIRTALALMAGAVGVDQFSPQLSSPLLRHSLALSLVVAGSVLGGLAWRRWRHNEYAMRLDQQLSYSRFICALSLFLIIIALLLGVMLWG
ncbi:DUF202 domain-containing protein [Salmonella enterica]|uniref:DUF202 domain-containing protein n=3 Tax=Salmonella enterica TaxID=28901 RepID=A0A742ZCB9_SALER|nr:hypothetical protein [Salmonella enterica subsp. enterica serovar Koketime]EAB8207514.1 DUF202 domain-containing protein [Salmonella enterica subsp. enterica serovar Lattenkamp]EAM8931896.1 DUF202 domain-containing protein [Salmonella enterica]ECG8591138.1 DUF202 domain-containing protein [Salmonella enterica subsp. salamae]ECJ3923093.1 DUF202 domain-containing protein [Salmonella enterica subsp. enterica]EHG3458933.1 DUF202 domain-containing protein [Salmonella enterica subsp. enterica ser